MSLQKTGVISTKQPTGLHETGYYSYAKLPNKKPITQNTPLKETGYYSYAKLPKKDIQPHKNNELPNETKQLSQNTQRSSKNGRFKYTKRLVRDTLHGNSLFMYKNTKNNSNVFVKRGRKAIYQQGKIMKKLQDCPYVMELTRFNQNNNEYKNNTNYKYPSEYTLYTPYKEGGNLAQYFIKHTNLSYDTIIPIVIKILSGVQCIHDHGIYHLDLKPDNIMYNAGDIKIIDFESAHEQIKEEPKGSCELRDEHVAITKLYALPSLLDDMFTGKYISGLKFNAYHQDLYSLGEMFNILVNHCAIKDTRESYMKIINMMKKLIYNDLNQVIADLNTLLKEKTPMTAKNGAVSNGAAVSNRDIANNGAVKHGGKRTRKSNGKRVHTQKMKKSRYRS